MELDGFSHLTPDERHSAGGQLTSAWAWKTKCLQTPHSTVSKCGWGKIEFLGPCYHGAKIIDKRPNLPAMFLLCNVSCVSTEGLHASLCANQLRVLKVLVLKVLVLGGPREHFEGERTSSQLRDSSIEERTMCSRNMKARPANLDQRAKDFLSGLLWLIAS